MVYSYYQLRLDSVKSPLEDFVYIFHSELLREIYSLNRLRELQKRSFKVQ